METLSNEIIFILGSGFFMFSPWDPFPGGFAFFFKEHFFYIFMLLWNGVAPLEEIILVFLGSEELENKRGF